MLDSALVPPRYPTGDGGQTATELAIDPATFRDAFAADLSESSSVGPLGSVQTRWLRRPVWTMAVSNMDGFRSRYQAESGRRSAGRSRNT